MADDRLFDAPGAPDVGALMDAIRRRIVERRERGELYDDELEPFVRERIARRLRAGTGEGISVLGLSADGRLEPVCELRSHRRMLGPVLVFLKRLLVRPLVKWVVDWAERNVQRQRVVNQRLESALVEVACEAARAEQRTARLERRCAELEREVAALAAAAEGEAEERG